MVSAYEPGMQPHLSIFPSSDQLVHAAAEAVVEAARVAVETRGCFCWCLSGGRTPRALYQLLAQSSFAARIPWGQTHVYWGDERQVPPDHEDSNYKMAWNSMLAHVPIDAAHIHRFHTELGDPEEVVQRYREDVSRSCAVSATDAVPCFDMTLLGMGPDGHTASLFPGVSWPATPGIWVAALWVPSLRAIRYSLLPIALNHSRAVLILVEGSEKAAMVARVWAGKGEQALPVQLIRPEVGDLAWYVDQAAAQGLPADFKKAIEENEAGGG